MSVPIIGFSRDPVLYWCSVHDQPSEPWRGCCLSIDPSTELAKTCNIEGRRIAVD